MSNAAEKIQESNIIPLNPGRWVLEKIMYQIFGFTKDQLYRYRAEGVMLEGIHYIKNPAKRIVYNVEAVNNWMEGK